MSNELWSTGEVVEATGIRARSLDYWIRNGVVKPTQSSMGSGFPHGFSDDDVRLLIAIDQLAKLGCQRPLLTKAAIWITRYVGAGLTDSALILTPSGDHMVMKTDHPLSVITQPSWVIALDIQLPERP